MTEKIVTKNGRPRKFPIEGTSLVTDEIGIQEIEGLKKRYVGKVPDGSQMRQALAHDMTRLFQKLREDGRVFRKDGSRVG